MPVMYDPKAIANFFLALAEERGKELTPLQVIKLVYIAHGWHLGLTGRPLINEAPEAWQYGPVVPSVYHEFKQFGNRPITSRASEIDWPTFTFKEIKLPEDGATEPLRGFLARIFDIYGKHSGGHLSTITHMPGTPWYLTWFELGGKDRKGVDIPEHLIKKHYEELRARNAGQQQQHTTN